MGILPNVHDTPERPESPTVSLSAVWVPGSVVSQMAVEDKVLATNFNPVLLQ